MPDDEWPEDFELQSEAVKNCAESIIDDPDSGIDDKSTAFATCQAMESKGQLKAPEDDELAFDTQPIHALADALDMTPPGRITRSEDDDGVRYRNMLILGPGEWTDSATGETLFYAPELAKHIAEAPEERVPERNGRRQNKINFNHESRDQLKQVGHFDVSTLQSDEHGNLYADVVFWNDTTASQDAVALMDRALQSDGQQGAGGFSVEIPFENEVTEFDRERGMEKMVAGDIAGLAIVTDSAAAQAQTAQQFANRAVALAADDDTTTYHPTIALSDSGQRDSMADADAITDLDGLADYDDDAQLLEATDGEDTYLLADGDTVSIDIEGASIEQIRDALSGSTGGQDLADGDVPAAVDEYLAQDGSPEDGVDEFLQWANANLDMDMDALEAAAADYLAESDVEDLSETPVSEFMAFLDGDGGDEPPEDDEDDMEEMQENLSAVKEENRELRAEIDDLASRLEGLEDRPDYGEDVTDDGEDDDRDLSGNEVSPHVRHNGRISR